MGKRAMATPQSTHKERLIELLILAFVIVSVSLLTYQLGTNVANTLGQSQSANGDTIQVDVPLGPTPTIDFSLPISEMK
jgi:hypothetical protein